MERKDEDKILESLMAPQQVICVYLDKMERKSLIKESGVDILQIDTSVKKDDEKLIDKFYNKNKQRLNNNPNIDDLSVKELIRFLDYHGYSLYSADLSLENYYIAGINSNKIYMYRIDKTLYA